MGKLREFDISKEKGQQTPHVTVIPAQYTAVYNQQ